MKYKIWWLIAAGVILMGVGMIGSGAILKAGSATPLPKTDLISVIAGTGSTQASSSLTLTEISDMQTATKGSIFSCWANGKGTIGTDTRNTQADVYAVTGAFQDIHHIDMMYGSFLPRADKTGMSVVLDNNLAYRIFGTENAVGLEVQFDGKTFQVCGISRADTSLLGLVSGNGMARAYLSGYELISTGKLAIGGFEAMLPHDAPGVSLSAVTAAMQTENLAPSSFLMADETAQASLNKEVTQIPMVLLAISAMLVLLFFFIRVVRGIFKESRAILHDSYFSNVWDALAWRFCKIVLVLAGCIGLSWLLWAAIGFNLDLPAKYIPGSWIDSSFYSTLLKTESQAAIAAQAYTKLWWDTAYSTAVSLSVYLDVIAFIGTMLTALSLRTLWADRKAAATDPHAKTGSLWDIVVLWVLALVSFGAFLLMNLWMGLPLQAASGALVVLALGLGIWATAMHKQKLESLLYTKQEGFQYGTDAGM